MPFLGDLLFDDSKFFAKSEFGPAASHWPALSFSSRKIASDFQRVCRRGRDFVIYVGTSNPTDTPVREHRQALLSVVDVEPRAIVDTKTIVDPQSWARAQERYPNRWDFSFRLARAWDIGAFPRAHELLPHTYAKFTNPGTRGHPIPVEPADYSRLRFLEIAEVDLALTERAVAILARNVDDALLRKELSRLATLVQSDIDRAGTPKTGSHPHRGGLNYSDIFAALNQRWHEQEGACALCGRQILLKTSNRLLQISRDRIDSADKNYVLANVQLTHFGCNLAKSSATMEEWQEYYSAITAAIPLSEAGVEA